MSNLPILISTELTIEEILKIDEGLGSRIYKMVSDYKGEILGSKNNHILKRKNINNFTIKKQSVSRIIREELIRRKM